MNWLRLLVAKAFALCDWQAKVESNSLLKSSLKLTDVFRPDTFLNALRQQTARVTGCAPSDGLGKAQTWQLLDGHAEAALRLGQGRDSCRRQADGDHHGPDAGGLPV